MKRIVIIGATSGIGKETALLFARRGWRVGAVGRRENLLMQLKASMPTAFETQVLDVTATDAPEQLDQLIRKLGGMDVFLLCSGIGTQNPSLQPEPELHTATTNVGGFIRMTTAAFNYFKAQGGGHLAAITSIAGTKGLGIAPAYSATKRFQNNYLDALAQLARMQHLHIRVTDIRPGFVDTDLIKGRRSEIINVGGQKVYPAEVESVILQMEGVLDAAVSGEKNPILGNIVTAKVHLASDETVKDFTKRMKLFCKDKLQSYQIPQKVTIMQQDFTNARFKKIRR